MKSVVFAILLLIVGCKDAGQSTPGFIAIHEGEFRLNGEEYRYIGVNMWYAPILASQGRGGDRERLGRELDLLRSIGVNNLRVLVGADGPDGVPTKIEPALQTSPGIYNDTIFDGLDYLLQELESRGMHAVLYLNNSWEWSGGYSQYLQWCGHGDIPIPAISGWPAYMDYVTGFVRDEEAKDMFAKHVENVITRTNRYTGRKYCDEPSIMSWQIGNEPRAFSDDNKVLFTRWIASVAAQIRLLDPNHLISVGSEGKHGCEEDIELWRSIHADPNIDYTTIHIWPNNWGWIKKDSMEAQLGSAITNTHAYINSHAAISTLLRKPMVLEEFGMPRDSYGFDPAVPTTARDKYFTDIFSSIVTGDMLSGCNIWAWAGYARATAGHVFWQRGDAYMGDPAQEEQGLNSLFDTDTTLTIIKHYNEQLAKRNNTR